MFANKKLRKEQTAGLKRPARLVTAARRLFQKLYFSKTHAKNFIKSVTVSYK